MIVCAFLMQTETSFGSTYRWDLSNSAVFRGWLVENADQNLFQEQGIIRSWKDPGTASSRSSLTQASPRLISPPDLNLPLSDRYILKAGIRNHTEEYVKVLLYYHRAGTPEAFIGSSDLAFEIQPRRHDTFEVLLPSQPAVVVDRFILLLQGGDDLSFDSIELFAASPLQHACSEMNYAVTGTYNIRGRVINGLRTPVLFSLPLPALLYALAMGLPLVGIVLMRRFHPDRTKRTFILSFLAIALITSVWTDYAWWKKLLRDVDRFSGKTVAQRITSVLEDDSTLDDFISSIDAAKTMMPRDAKVLILANARVHRDMGKYYMLPRETSDDAEFIWTFNSSAVFDPLQRTLSFGPKTISSVKRVFILKENSVLYQRTISEPK